MQSKSLVNVLLAVVTVLGATGVRASLLDSRMDAYKVETSKGKETLHPATVAEPGNVLEYKLTYTSKADKPLAVQHISVPVPQNTHYLPNSAYTSVASQFQVSIDGGKHWESEPVKRMRKGKDGKLEEVTIPESEYTHLRWQEKNDIGPGAVQTFHYRVKVL